MRIISGKHKGRKFHPPNNLPTRPTTDFAKTGLFNILNNYFDFEEVKVLDLFCGTGNISYEFSSRGCTDITSVDRDNGASGFVKKTATELNMTGLVVIRNDVLQFIRNAAGSYDLIFAGPPYAMPEIDLLPDLILEKKMLRESGWLILEHSPQHDFKNHPRINQVRNYSKTIFSIFTP